MKNLKIFFLFAFCVFPFFYSCNEDSPVLKEENILEVDELAEYKTAKFFEESVKLISKEFEEKIQNSFKNGEEIELTQAELDQAIAISEYSGPVPSLEDVNTIINQTLTVFHTGEITFPMPLSEEYPPLNEKTNTLLSQIFSDGSIVDLRLILTFS